MRCGRRVGRPVAITTLTLCLGFLSVAFSEFATLRQFAADLILLPALLVRARV